MLLGVTGCVPTSLLVHLANESSTQDDAHRGDPCKEEKKTLELDPNFVSALKDLGAIYVQKSMYNEAIGG